MSLREVCEQAARDRLMLSDDDEDRESVADTIERVVKKWVPEWTTTPPTKPGWYWAEVNGVAFLTLWPGVDLDKEGQAYGLLSFRDLWGTVLEGKPERVKRWAGPIEAPEVPK